MPHLLISLIKGIKLAGVLVQRETVEVKPTKLDLHVVSPP